jgi:hypothetical protein
VLSNATREGANTYVERVRNAFRAAAITLGDPPLDVSVGVATYDPAMTSMEDLIAAADAALYEAKAAKKATGRYAGAEGTGLGDAAPEAQPGPAGQGLLDLDLDQALDFGPPPGQAPPDEAGDPS